MTHGFSTLPILKMVESQNLKVDRLVLISPFVDIYAYQRRLVELSVQDFLRLKDIPVASQLKILFEQSHELFDHPMQQALQIAFHNPCLFDHFWQDLNHRDVWFMNMEERESQLDLVSWQAVNQDLVQVVDRLKLLNKVSIPTTVILGERDHIVKARDIDEALSPLLEHFEIKIFPRAGHFPHLESPDRFVSHLIDRAPSELMAS